MSGWEKNWKRSKATVLSESIGLQKRRRESLVRAPWFSTTEKMQKNGHRHGRVDHLSAVGRGGCRRHVTCRKRSENASPHGRRPGWSRPRKKFATKVRVGKFTVGKCRVCRDATGAYCRRAVVGPEFLQALYFSKIDTANAKLIMSKVEPLDKSPQSRFRRKSR